jgi:hypothetical protein
MTSFWYVFVSDLGISATADSNMPSVVASYLVVAAKGETNAEQRKRAASPQNCGAQDTGESAAHVSGMVDVSMVDDQ